MRALQGVRHVDEARGDPAALASSLRDVDILVLCHGEAALESDDAREASRRRDSVARVIESFRKTAAQRRFPPEVWDLGREKSASDAEGSAARREWRRCSSQARRYFLDDRLIYRHILLPGTRAMSRERAARIALWLIARGLNYVPLRLTWGSVRGYLAFVRSPLPS